MSAEGRDRTEELGKAVYPFFHIDTTDKIMGIPVRHFAVGLGTAILVSTTLSSLTSSSPALLLLVPLSGYLAYRASLQMEKTFPGTSFRYYLNWFQGGQVYVPDRDEVAAPLVVPDDL